MVPVAVADEPVSNGDLLLKRKWHICQPQRSYILYLCHSCFKNSVGFQHSNNTVILKICSSCAGRNAEAGCLYSEYFVNKKKPLTTPLSTITVDVDEDALEIVEPRSALVFHLCSVCSEEQFSHPNKVMVLEHSNETFCTLKMCEKCFTGNLKISKCI